MALNLKTIDLNLLVIFEAVYSTGNISNASERLNMSQPAVSNALTRLRQHVDDPLFTRATRGVVPTNKAHEMIEPIRAALGLIESQFEGEELDLSTYERSFRIAMVDSVELDLVPPVLKTITEHAPGVSMECFQITPDYAEDLRGGKLDLVCFSYPADTTDLVIEPCSPADIVAITKRDHPEIPGTLDLETYGQLGHVALNRNFRRLTHADKDFAANSFDRRIVYMVNKLWSMPAIVARTDLVGLLPRRFAEEIKDDFKIDIHEVPVPMSEQYSYLMWHVGNDRNPGHRWLREQMLKRIRAFRAEMGLDKTG